MWDGSLYGQLEASAVLMACVTLCNADGILDMTPQAISGRTGWPLDFVTKGIDALEQVDPRSRTPDDDGRRLSRLDDHRNWGWLIVNYEKYRSLSDPDTVRTQTRERVRKHRENRNAEKQSVTVGNGHVTGGNAKKKQKQKNIKKYVEAAPSTPVTQVFDHWRSTWNHPTAKLDSKREKAITAAMTLYPPETLCKAITGYLKSDYHCGKNEHGRVYDDIELFVRDAKRIETGLNLADAPAKDDW